MESGLHTDDTPATHRAEQTHSELESAFQHSSSTNGRTRRSTVRMGGIRRHSTRIMREIIKALSENMHQLEEQEIRATGGIYPQALESPTVPAGTSGMAESFLTPSVLRGIRSDQRSGVGREFMPGSDRLTSKSPKITLLRSQDLCTQPQITTELNCNYCGKRFHLEDGGALFEGKAACGNCEQHLNRDIVLPTMNRPRLSLLDASASGAERAGGGQSDGPSESAGRSSPSVSSGNAAARDRSTEGARELSVSSA